MMHHERLLSTHRRRVPTFLLPFVLVTLLTACGQPASSTTAPSTTPTSLAASSTTVTAPTLTSSPESQRYQNMLKETYGIANSILQEMENRGAPADDADAARVFALRARAQAIIACKAVIEKQPDLADAAVAEMRKLLSRAAAVPASQIGDVVTAALAACESVPQPSTDPEGARAALEKIIDTLAALVSEASLGDWYTRRRPC